MNIEFSCQHCGWNDRNPCSCKGVARPHCWSCGTPVRFNLEWLENMEKIRDKWGTTYLDMLYWGELFMPEEMGFIYWQIGKPDGQLPYRDRGYFEYEGKIVKSV